MARHLGPGSVTETSIRRQALIRFAAVMAAGHLLWEIAHVPLYTLWLTGTAGEIAYAILHCTVGDLMIAAICFGAALVLFGKGWPRGRVLPVALVTIALAVGYTVFSEWLNTEVRAAWTYREIMPRLPPFGTGLTPVLQWIVVPTAAFAWIRSGLHCNQGKPQ